VERIFDRTPTIRVIHNNKDKLIGYNPAHPILPGTTVSLPHPYRIEELDWDPGEW